MLVKSRFTVALALLVSVAAAAVLCAQASADSTAFKTKIFAEFSSGDSETPRPGFFGSVRARGAGAPRACTNHRTIVVYRKREGDDRVVGMDKSNKTGFWGFFDNPRDGVYFAIVKRRDIGGGVACRAARSRTIAVEDGLQI